jgi:gliding motility-associated lipoprotein GldH
VDEFHALRNQSWAYTDSVKVALTEIDTATTYNLYINVRHSGDYAYRNLYVRLHLTNPQGETASQVVSFELADAAGRWHGKGLGDLYEYRIPWKSEVKFAYAGDYQLHIEQFMRENPLLGIADVGARLEKAAD